MGDKWWFVVAAVQLIWMTLLMDRQIRELRKQRTELLDRFNGVIGALETWLAERDLSKSARSGDD